MGLSIKKVGNDTYVWEITLTSIVTDGLMPADLRENFNAHAATVEAFRADKLTQTSPEAVCLPAGILSLLDRPSDQTTSSG